MDEKKDTYEVGALVSMLNLLGNGSNANGDESALARSVLLSRISSCKNNNEACKMMIAWRDMAYGIMASCDTLFPAKVEPKEP